MKKILFATVLASVIVGVPFTFTINAQTPASSCTEKTAQALTVRGLRLGMTADEVLALFPQATRREEIKAEINAPPKSSYGYSYTGFSGDQLDSRSPSSKWVGVQVVRLYFFDGKLVGFNIQYVDFNQGGARWNNADEFIAKLAGPLGLPSSNYWEDRSSGKKLSCGQITIVVDTQNGGGGGSINIYDDRNGLEVKRRAEADREERRRAFKP